MTALSGHLGDAHSPSTSPAVYSAPDLEVALRGQPRWAGRHLPMPQLAAEFAQAFRDRGDAALADLHGAFAVAVSRPLTQELWLATDRFGIEPVYFRADPAAMRYSTALQDLAAGAALDPQALYDYVYFHCIPAPRTIYANVYKLPAGHVLRWRPGREPQLARYWQADFAEQQAGADAAGLHVQLRDLLVQAVDRSSPPDGNVGAYLSGGLDSSSVVATAARRGDPLPTFSIGFDATGYDELPFARIVAARFGTQAHEHYVTPRDVLDTLPVLAAGYEQPFGNASAIPAYQCARLARQHGVDTLLAGDGGDEIFGGNARYAKQGHFEHYGRLPGWLRRGLVEPLAVPLANRMPVLGKLGSYVKQARIPLPARLQTYNQLERLGPRTVFGGDFLAAVDCGEPLRVLEAEYAAAPAQHYVNRLLALDAKFTLADNDLPKVTGTAALAGVAVAFPMLDEDLVAFGYRLPIRHKVDGTALRPLFRQAMRGVLPDETLSKSKHGFGLPFGVWLGSDAGLQELADDSLTGLGTRGWFDEAFLRRLKDDLHGTHLAFWGELVWVLVMLEQWLRQHPAGPAAGGDC
ncbi:MAG: asparagine synthetase B family protein [Pseudomonadota bacterium]